MSNRLKVLMSAYACEPNKGSEPEVGWQWALQMARFHEVTVLTRENNRQAIEGALEALRGKRPLPRFVYQDCGPFWLGLKKRIKGVKFYYLLWQRSARKWIAGLHQAHRYDLMHHVTFAAFRYPIAVWGHGVPCIWGPVGGIPALPNELLPWGHSPALLNEAARRADNLIQNRPFRALEKRARLSTRVLVSTREMQATLAGLGFETRLMPTIGLDVKRLPFEPHRPAAGPLRLLFVGQIIYVKGVDLALEGLKASGTDASLTFVGSGNYLNAIRQLAQRLGLGERVRFQGRVPRQKVLRIYPNYDLFLFPSLHDTGGYAVLEAMFNELPVICLDCQGPAIAVRDDCGTRVRVGTRAEVVEAVGAAIRRYDQDRDLLRAQGQAARQSVLRYYDWEKKGCEMAECYQETVALSGSGKGSSGCVPTIPLPLS